MKYSSGREKLSVSWGEKGQLGLRAQPWCLPSPQAHSTYSPCGTPGGACGTRAPGLLHGDVLAALQPPWGRL